MLADLFSFDHDLVQGVELDQRVAEDDDRRQDPLEDVPDQRDPLFNARNRQANSYSIKNKDPGKDEILKKFVE